MPAAKPSLTLNGVGIDSLHDLTLVVRPGQVVCLTGPSGCGKTRLLRAIADLEPHTGCIGLGEELQTQVSGHAWRRRVMLVPAESQWWQQIVGAHFDTIDDEDLTALGFGREVLGWDVSRLSSGEKQRLALLRALSRKPDALLLDEPTANLDSEGVRRAERWLCHLIRLRQLPTLWVTHDLDQVARVGDHHLRFNHGLQLEVA